MMIPFRRVSNLVLVFLSTAFLVDQVSSSSFHSENAQMVPTPSRFDALRDRAQQYDMPAELRGKTMKDLMGVSSSPETKVNQQIPLSTNTRRQTQDMAPPVYEFFAVYDEFGPLPFTSLGDTAGLRGIIYDLAAKEDGLDPAYISGALQATCSVVASSGVQMCTYEIFVILPEFMGTVVATGSLSMEIDKQNLLIVEATGDDYVDYKNGFLAITYIATGDQTIIDLQLLF